jgi:hypothetical protein
VALVLSKIRKTLAENRKVLAALASLVILLNAGPQLFIKAKSALMEKDVTFVQYDGREVKELATKVASNYRHRIVETLSDEKEMEKTLKAFEEKVDSDIDVDLNSQVVKDFVDFLFEREKPDLFFKGGFYVLEIENNRGSAIRDLSVRVPDVYEVSQVELVTDVMPPDKVEEFEKSWKLNKEAKVLFLPTIQELPAYKTIQIYVFGTTPGVGLDGAYVKYDGGVAKEIRTGRRLPGLIEYGVIRWFRFSWQTLLVSITLALVVYLVYIVRKQSQRQA